MVKNTKTKESVPDEESLLSSSLTMTMTIDADDTTALSSSSTSSTSISTTMDQQSKMPSTSKINEWVNAPEFVPSSSSSLSAAEHDVQDDSTASTTQQQQQQPGSYARAVCSSGTTVNPASEPLCPYGEATGFCKKLECPYLHGDICELCGRAALHPFNEDSRQKHTNVRILIKQYFLFL